MTIPLQVLAIGVGMMACEVARPGRSWPLVPGWWTRAALLNGVQAGMVYLAGWAWDGWMLAQGVDVTAARE
jgi:hypothetical protein